MKLSKLSLAIIAAAGLLSLAPSIQAQTNTPGTPPPGRRGGAMNPEARLTAFETALGTTNKLTEAQKPKVKAVIEEQTKKMQELRGQRDSLGQDELRTKMQALTEDTNKKMKEILNADQYGVWEKQAQRGRGGRRQGGGGGGGAGGGQNN